MHRVRTPSVRLVFSASIAGLLAFAAAGCTVAGLHGGSHSLAGTDTTRVEAERRRVVEAWGARYRANPRDATAALNYAKALGSSGRRVQAASVLEQASLRNPRDKALLGAYGRALAETGRFDQAVKVLSHAHSPDQPDWRVLSAHGAALDQLGRHRDAQRYYSSALKISPNEPTVLSNLGLSYALAKDLTKAEATLRKAAAQPAADPRVRQNLALVVGLRGRFAEAEKIARTDLPETEAAANIAYLRQMLAQKGKAPPAKRHARITAQGKG